MFYLTQSRFSDILYLCAIGFNFTVMIAKNNPLNIRFSITNFWKGQIGQRKGFVVFSNLSFGIRAACIIIMRSYRKKGLCTIRQVVSRWAPSSENNTDAYISYVCRMLDMNPDSRLSELDYPMLISAMSWMEVGFEESVTAMQVKAVIDSFNIKPFSI